MFFSKCFPRQWACACFLLLAGHQRPRKGDEKPPIMALITFLVGPRKTHETRPRVRRCFESNDSEPRKSHKNSTKSPRKLHERTTNSKISGSLARTLDSRAGSQKFDELWPSNMCKGCKEHPSTGWKPRAICCPNMSAIKSISEASGFHTRFFHMFCGLPTKAPFLTVGVVAP